MLFRSINICIPYLSIEKVLDKLVVQYWFQANTEEILSDSKQKLKDRLNVVEVPVSAVLGKTFITVDDFLNLTIGDVVTLNSKSIDPVELKVENQPCYYCKPGVVGKNMGVQILDNIDIDKDVEDYE